MAITDKKGINVTSGFKLISPAPIDARYVVEDETELQSIIDIGSAYNGLEVWVNSLGKKKQYNGTEFVEVQAGGGVSEEVIGDINAVLDEINGGGTIGGGSSSEVEIEFSIGTPTSEGIYPLTQITPFTDWYKVKNARIILKGTNQMATPSDIEAWLPNIMKTIEQGTNNVGLLSLTGTVFTADGVMSVASILYQNNYGFNFIANEDILFILNMYIELGTTTCKLIVTI